MKRLFSSPSTAELGLLQSRLENAGIACEMRNEFTGQTFPMITTFEPELWVLKDEDFAEASELMAAWEKAAPSEQQNDATPGAGQEQKGDQK